MDDRSPSRPLRPTPPQSRPFARPEASNARPTPLSTRPVLFMPGGHRHATSPEGSALVEGEPAIAEPSPVPGPSDEPWFPEPTSGVAAILEASPHVATDAATGPRDEPLPAETDAAASASLDRIPVVGLASREAVAGALVAVADRVRAGGVPLPDGLEGRSESALLAAVLASLLGDQSGMGTEGEGGGGAAVHRPEDAG